MGWEYYVGTEGGIVGLDGFGASAPYKVLYKKFGITAQDAVEKAEAVLNLLQDPLVSR